MAETADVVVIGAGVVGSGCAYYLADRGLKVVVLEREAIASGASGHATGGMTLLSHDFFSEDHLRAGIESYHMTADLVPLLEDLTGVSVQYQRKPGLRLALEEDEVADIHRLVAWQGKLLKPRWIDGDEVRRLEPRLSPEIRGGMYEDESAQVDSARYTLALATAAERRGARILLRPATGLMRDGDRVTGVYYRGGEISSAAVIIAMGHWSALASKWLDFDVPVRSLKGEKLYLQLDGPPIPLLVNSPKRGHLHTRVDGYLSVGATGGRAMEDKTQWFDERIYEDGADTEPTEAALKELLQRGIDVMPAVIDAEVAQQLAGPRPLSPDRTAILGPVPGRPGAYLATGHTSTGIKLAAIGGRYMADLITRGHSDLPVSMEAFSPNRFADRSYRWHLGPGDTRN